MRRIHVVAAVIRNAEGRILIARRPADKHQGGLWEFPGGKVEAGELAEVALARELEEELGVTPTTSRPLIQIAHDYPDKQVLLDVWLVSGYRGEAHGREQQPLQWVTARELNDFSFPAANLPIITAAQLSDTLLITPDPAECGNLSEWLARHINDGIRLVMLRAPALPTERYLALAKDTLAQCRAAGVSLLLHGDPALLDQVNADGCHLDSKRLMQMSSRAVSRSKWLSASTHNREELMQAMQLGLDFVTLSPVQPTPSHPGAAVLGWDAFADLVRHCTVPVYALGGMSRTDLPAAWAAGAQGVAGIRRLGPA